MQVTLEKTGDLEGRIKVEVSSADYADQVGATYNYLRHAGLSGNGSIITKRAIIKQSTLISGGNSADYKDGV